MVIHSYYDTKISKFINSHSFYEIIIIFTYKLFKLNLLSNGNAQTPKFKIRNDLMVIHSYYDTKIGKFVNGLILYEILIIFTYKLFLIELII